MHETEGGEVNRSLFAPEFAGQACVLATECCDARTARLESVLLWCNAFSLFAGLLQVSATPAGNL